MDFTSVAAEQRYAAVVREAPDVVVGLDFDGTLAPIVEDPAAAVIHPEAPAVLADLASQVGAVAVITGRPARQVLALGGLEQVGDAVEAAGKDLYVFGQYGHERWSTRERRVVSPRPPAGLASFERELPRLLRRLDAAAAHVEDKGLAVAVHTRRLPDDDEAFARLLPELRDLAGSHDLVVEPGHSVIEVRSSGSHKGMVVERLAADLDARGFVFCGDDLGDVEAWESLTHLDRGGIPTLRVYAAAQDDAADQPLRRHADVVVPGPDGVLALLRELADDARALRA